MLLLVLMLLLLRNVLLEFNLGLGWLAKQRVHHLFLERAHAQGEAAGAAVHFRWCAQNVGEVLIKRRS